MSDLLPGMLLVGLGVRPMFVAVATAANAGLPADAHDVSDTVPEPARA